LSPAAVTISDRAPRKNKRWRLGGKIVRTIRMAHPHGTCSVDRAAVKIGKINFDNTCATSLV
jgi:hypothetical protein